MKRVPRLHAVNYSTALRCIGQELELRGLRTIDLVCDKTGYIVLCGYQPPPASMPVTLRYTPTDILELDGAGQEQRGNSPPSNDFVTIVQILRAIGGYLDKNQARLLRISNSEPRGNSPSFSVEYETREGERVIDDRDGAAIYDMCVSMYKQRRKVDHPAAKFPSDGTLK
jgi:hypothetical protein